MCMSHTDALYIERRVTCAGLGGPGGGLGAEVLAHHLLQRAHEDGDEPVDVAGVIAAGGLQDHQRPWGAHGREQDTH